MQNTLHRAWHHNFKERQTVTLHWHHPQPPPLHPSLGPGAHSSMDVRNQDPTLLPTSVSTAHQCPNPWCPGPRRDKVRSEEGLSGLGVTHSPSLRGGKPLNPSDSKVTR